MRTSISTDSTSRPLSLRQVLLADGVVSGVFGILLLTAAGPLSDPLGLSVAFLRWTGLMLAPFAAVVLYLATCEAIPRRGVSTIVGINVLWVLASLLLLLTGWIDQSGLGTAFIVAQAALVALFAELQFVGLRRRS
ncbi:MAG: hypothetical protein H0V47_01580 [Chloroflexia bacterium]|nr:hypothetical protein [Chloroflexia bacterium]